MGCATFPHDAELRRAQDLTAEALYRQQVMQVMLVDQEAIRKAEEALNIRERILGPDNLQVAVSLQCLARMHETARNDAKAKPLYERAVLIYTQTLGPTDPVVVLGLERLARVLQGSGDAVGARAIQDRIKLIGKQATQGRTLGADDLRIVESLHSLAELYRHQITEWAVAQSLYERALAIREKALGPEHLAVAESLQGLANSFMSDPNKLRRSKAGPLYERALAIREKALGPEHPAVAETLLGLAEFYNQQAQIVRFLRLAQRGLTIQERTLGPEHLAVAESLLLLARYYRNVAPAKAEPLYRRVLAIREKAWGVDGPLTFGTIFELAGYHHLQGHYVEAETFYRRALDILEKNPSQDKRSDMGEILLNLAVLYEARDQRDQANVLTSQAMALLEEYWKAEVAPNELYNPRKLNEILVSSFLLFGHDCFNKGQYTQAERVYQWVVKLGEEGLGKNHADVLFGLKALAEVYQVQGRYRESESIYQRVLPIWEKNGNQEAIVGALHGLADLHHIQGRFREAEAFYQRALTTQEKALGSEHTHVAWRLLTLAEFYRLQSRYDEAELHYRRAIDIQEKSLTLLPQEPTPTNSMQAAFNLAPALIGLANLYRSQGRNALAENVYRRALAIQEEAIGPENPWLSSSLAELAELYIATGNYLQADQLLHRSLKIQEEALGANHPDVAHSLNKLAKHLRSSGDYAAARPLYERALRVLEETPLPELRWSVALGLGEVHERQGRLIEALGMYREAVQTLDRLASQFVEEVSRHQYLKAESRLEPYDALARLLLKLHEQDATKGYDREAWAVLEAKKGRIIAEILAAAGPKPQDPRPREEAEKLMAKQDQAIALERGLREEKAKLPQEQRPERIQNLTVLLAQTKREYLAQVQTFLARYPQYKMQFIDQQTVDPKALAKFADRLPAETLAVQYFAAPDALYLFVVGPGGRFQVKSRAISQTELYELVREYRQSLERATSQRLMWNDDKSEIFQREVAPFKELASKLAGHLLAPIEGELATYRNLILIPNDLLLYLPIHALTREQHDGSVRFLAETHAVSYLTQLELVDLIKPEKPLPTTPLLALANPDGSLPGASREVRALTGVRPSVTALEGAQATKATFLDLVPQFPDLHLATHGVLNLERPERSYLLMAGKEEANQRLGIDEIAGLSLRNGIAVLSACETALGELVPGAALMTLAAAFSQAGSQSVVASLWKVNDAATRDFMVVFHRALPAVGPAGALQQAQLAVLSNPATSHPYFWAPFILIGAR